MVACTHWLRPEYTAGVKGLIFDCDGVLFDSFTTNQRYYNLILSRLGLGEMTPAQENFVHIHTVQESLLHIAPNYTWAEIEEARKTVDYFTEIMPYLVPEPGLFELLSRLKSNGYVMGICTNRTNTMERVAWRFGLHHYFSPILTAVKAKPKPNPECVHVTLRTWRMKPEDVIYIGDSIVDERTARAAGVRFWSYKNPELLSQVNVESFWEMAQAFNLAPGARGLRHNSNGAAAR